MANTSTIHIKTDFDCIVYDYDQEIGNTKADTYTNFELRKGEHELTFEYIDGMIISKTINYVVEDADCDYRLVVEIVDVIYKEAIDLSNGLEYYFLEEAYCLFMKAAEKGYSKAQNSLGDCYKYGIGIEKDFAKAVDWYTKAARQGNATAQFNLGICFKNGEGVDSDHTKAMASDALYMTSILLRNQITTELSDKETVVVRKSE